MLRAYRAHKTRLASMQVERDAVRERLVSCRQWLTARLATASAHALLQRCWLGWRLAIKSSPLNSGDNGASGEAAPQVALPATHPPPPLPPRLTRKELYRMSYEALIDQVCRAGRGRV